MTFNTQLTIDKRQVLFKRFLLLIRKNRLTACIKELEHILELSSCSCFLNSQDDKDYKKTLNYIESKASSIFQYYEKYPSVLLIKGFIYMQLYKYEEAFDVLSKYIVYEPTYHLGYTMLARIRKDINPNCLEHAMKAVTLKPSAYNYFLLGSCHELEISDQIYNDLSLKFAISYFKQSLCILPESSCLNDHIGDIYFKSRRFENALHYFDISFTIKPNVGSTERLALTYIELDNHRSAYSVVLKGLKMNPDSTTLNFRAGCINFELGNYNKAINYFKKYIELSPHDYNAFGNLKLSVSKLHDSYLTKAQKYFTLKNYTKAKPYYELYMNSGRNLSYKKNEYFETLGELLKKDYQTERLELLNEKFSLIRVNFKEMYFEDEFNPDEYFIKYYTENDILNIAPYIGVRIEDVIEKDFQFILDCIVNIEDFCVIDDVFINFRKGLYTNVEESILYFILKKKYEPLILYDLNV